LLQDVVIPIADDLEALSRQNGVACHIALGRNVLAAVNLDHEATFKADKIQDVVSEWKLATKPDPGEPAVTQEMPHRRFCIGCVAPQAAGVAT